MVFDLDNSYIENKKTGVTTPIKVENGEFVFNLWIEAPAPSATISATVGGQFAALIEDESGTPFMGQDE